MCMHACLRVCGLLGLSCPCSFVSLDNQVPADVIEALRGMDDVREVHGAVITPYFYVEKEAPAPAIPSNAVNVASVSKPREKPANPNFGSGPTSKFAGWSLKGLEGAAIGRSHRSALGLKKLKDALAVSKQLLGVPADYHIGIVPGSDTGAFEMAMWTMLGPRTVDVAFWESFGKGWYSDTKSHLKLKCNAFKADYGHLPTLPTDPENDILFTWNGTTSGVMVPNADWIPKDRAGLVFCDATSAVFAQDVKIDKCDVVTYSWQKVGGSRCVAWGSLVAARVRMCVC
jgi:phosphoserine aminotransferase